MKIPFEITIPSGIHPTTVIVVDDRLELDLVRNSVDRFTNSDDVFDHHFLEFVIFVVGESARKFAVPEEVSAYLQFKGTSAMSILTASSWPATSPREGPYFSGSNGLYPVWKLFPDTQGAFVTSLIQVDPQK